MAQHSVVGRGFRRYCWGQNCSGQPLAGLARLARRTAGVLVVLATWLATQASGKVSLSVLGLEKAEKTGMEM